MAATLRFRRAEEINFPEMLNVISVSTIVLSLLANMMDRHWSYIMPILIRFQRIVIGLKILGLILDYDGDLRRIRTRVCRIHKCSMYNDDAKLLWTFNIMYVGPCTLIISHKSIMPPAPSLLHVKHQIEPEQCRFTKKVSYDRSH